MFQSRLVSVHVFLSVCVTGQNAKGWYTRRSRNESSELSRRRREKTVCVNVYVSFAFYLQRILLKSLSPTVIEPWSLRLAKKDFPGICFESYNQRWRMESYRNEKENCSLSQTLFFRWCSSSTSCSWRVVSSSGDFIPRQRSNIRVIFRRTLHTFGMLSLLFFCVAQNPTKLFIKLKLKRFRLQSNKPSVAWIHVLLLNYRRK